MILFNKNRQVQKHQAGGSVNYYSQYTVQPSIPAPRVNVGLMLAKHQSNKAAPASGEGKAKAADVPDLKGLKIDKEAWIEKDKELAYIIDYFANDPENPKYKEAIQARNILHTSGLDDLEQRQTEHTVATNHIKDQKIGSQWATMRDKGLYKAPDGNYTIRYTSYLNSKENKDEEGRRIERPVTHQESDGIRSSSYSYVTDYTSGSPRKGSFINDKALDNWAINTSSETTIYDEVIKPAFAHLGLETKSKKDELKGTELDMTEFQFTKEEVETIKKNPNNIAQILKSKVTKNNNNALTAATTRAIELLVNSSGFSTLLNNKIQNNPKIKTRGEAYQEVVKDIVREAAIRSNTTIINDLSLTNEEPEEENNPNKPGKNGVPGVTDLPEAYDALLGKTQPTSIKVEHSKGVEDEDGNTDKSVIGTLEGHKDAHTKSLLTTTDKDTKVVTPLLLSNITKELDDRLQLKKMKFVKSGVSVYGTMIDVDRAGVADWETLASRTIVDKEAPIIATSVFTGPNGQVIPITEHPRYKELEKELKAPLENLNRVKASSTPSAIQIDAITKHISKLTQKATMEILSGGNYKNTAGKEISVFGQNVKPGDVYTLKPTKAEKVAIMKVIYPDFASFKVIQPNGTLGGKIEDDNMDHQFNREYQTLNSGSKLEELYRSIGLGDVDEGERTTDAGDGRTAYVYVPYVESMVSQARSSGDSPLMMKESLLWNQLGDMDINKTNDAEGVYNAILNNVLNNNK